MAEQKSNLDRAIELLNMLIVLAQWDRKLPGYITRLCDNPEQYRMALEQIKWGLTQTAPDQLVPLPTFIITLKDEEWQSLYLGIARIAPVREAFSSEGDLASVVTADQMSLLSELSDITVDPQTVLYTRDGAFMGILTGVLDPLRGLAGLDINQQLADDLEKFLILYREQPKIANMLYDLALSGDWQIVLASLEDRRDYTEEGTSTAGETLKKWNEKLTPELHNWLFRPTYIARVPKDFVQLLWEGGDLLEEANNSIAPELATDPAARRKLIAAAALPLFRQKYAEQLGRVEANLRLRDHAARSFIKVRKFAKLDAFVYTWPEIARLSMARYRSLEFVEDCLVRRQQIPSEAELKANDARDLFNLCSEDGHFIRFLRLRPYFSEIDENELIRYKRIAPAVVETRQAASSATTQTPTTDTIKVTFTPTPPDFLTCYINIQRALEAGQNETADSTTYRVMFSFLDQVIQSDIRLSVRRLLQDMLVLIGATSQESLQLYLRDLFTGTGVNTQALLMRAGKHLLNAIFGSSDMTASFTRVLQQKGLRDDKHVRVIIMTDDPELFYLPWEWLPDPDQGEILVRRPQFSVVRSFPSDQWAAPLPPLLPPLRVLVVMPRVANLPVLKLDKQENLKKELANAPAELLFLLDEEATIQHLADSLLSFKPHILHFEGHISSVDTLSQPSLFFSSEEGQEPAIQPDIFSKLIREADVQLVVFGNNDASDFYNNPTAHTAATLVRMGLPAAIATIRGVDDATATGFTAEFYRSFLQGHTLENAISDARRKLSFRGGDWSAFALFANPTTLDLFYPLFRPQ